MDDINGVADDLEAVERVVVIGGGFIGLEAAAALRTLGKDVVVVEFLERLMARGVGATVSRFFADHHVGKGVDVRLSTGVTALLGESRVEKVALLSGEEITTQMVIVGIGVLPNTELAVDAGLECDDGVLVDENARTSDSDIFAAGDCTRFIHPLNGQSARLESVQNATDQARAAGAAIAGVEKPYDAAPWFWSDQFDLKLQMAGLTQGHDREVVIGSIEQDAFSVFYFSGDDWLGADSINRPGDHMPARRLLQSRYPLTADEVIANADSMKNLVKAACKG